MLFMMLILSLNSNGQSQYKNSLLQMIDEDRTTMDVIAGCEKNIQPHILLVAQTPELLNKIEELQKRSQDQFKTIIDRYDRDEQGAFYDLARYPNLISDLVSNGRPNENEVDRIVLNYPQDIREVAKKNGLRYFDVLLQIERLNNEIDHSFKDALQPYQANVRQSVNVLVGYPEIVSALVNDKPFTTLLGVVYREDPGWVMNRIDLTAQELATHNREDLEAYKNQIKQDPQAYNEMLEASEKFSQERNEVRYLDSNEQIVETRMINSYPYWFGYPYWYSDPYWRPQPLFYHTGMYRNNYGNIEIVALPSPFFLHWHSEYHPRLYPHLSYNYYNFYENHYMKRYNESPHGFPRQGFYKSIENHVINNPKVNNRSLQRIDRQRGGNIVQRPNINESERFQRSSSETGRSGDLNRSGYINRPGSSWGSGRGVSRGATVVPRNTDRPNSGISGGTSDQNNRRQFNTANPQRPEGNIIRSGSEGNLNRRNIEQGNTQNRNDPRVVPDRQDVRRAPDSGGNPIRNNAAVNPNQNNNQRVFESRPAQGQNTQRVVAPAAPQNNSRAAAPATPQNNTRVAAPAAPQNNTRVVRENVQSRPSPPPPSPKKEKEDRR